MARAHFVKKARKDNPDAGIKAGESYYWWKFRRGGRRFSKTPPKASQLTQSEYLSTILGIEEGISGSLETVDGLEDVAGELDSAADEVESAGSECADKASNMESAFPNGNPTIELLNQRNEDCERIAQELRDAAENIRSLDVDKEENETDDELLERLQGEVDDQVGNIDWSTE